MANLTRFLLVYGRAGDNPGLLDIADCNRAYSNAGSKQGRIEAGEKRCRMSTAGVARDGRYMGLKALKSRLSHRH